MFIKDEELEIKEVTPDFDLKKQQNIKGTSEWILAVGKEGGLKKSIKF